jgi:hypothetical protein
MMTAKKKTLHQLRDEILLAHRFFKTVNIEIDHIMCVLDYSVGDLAIKKHKLKQYIQNNFDKVLQVDVFSDYFVIWHYSKAVDEEHRTRKKVYLNENGQ